MGYRLSVVAILIHSAGLALAGQVLPTSGPPGGSALVMDNRFDGILGSGDQVSIWVLGLTEIPDRPISIEETGFIDVPILGRIRATGLRVDELRGQLLDRAKQYVRSPEVSVRVTESRSRPVSVVGAVNNPGLHQLQGRKTLIEVVAIAGGFRADAGHSIRITRRVEQGTIPLPNARLDQSSQVSTAEIALKPLLDGTPEQNIAIRPYDVITVPRAEMVYVVGEVQRAGGFVLNEQETLSALKVLALAGGLTQSAAAQRAIVLREVSGQSDRVETPVDLKKMLRGAQSDEALHAGDILFVPNSAAKSASKRALETAIQLGTGIVIWRH